MNTGEGEGEGEEGNNPEGGKPQETLKYREQTEGWWWGHEGEGKWLMGIEEGTCWDEQWVLYLSDESQESTPKTKSTLYTLYVSQLHNKLY